MAKRLESGEELHLLVSPKSRHLHQGYGPNVSLHHLPVVERAAQPADAERAPVLARAAAAQPHRRFQHLDGAGGQLPLVACPALQDHARVHRARSDQAAAPALPPDELPALGRGAADAIIINSESLRAEIKRYLEVDDAQAQADLRGRRPRPVPAGRRRAQARAVRRRRHGVTKPFVLFVSSLWPYKNCDGLLRAWAVRPARARRTASWRSSAPDGTRSTSPRCTRWQPSSASPTTWSSWAACRLRRPSRFYRAADVFVYPSLNETFGLPILEAMACGCPVVTSDTSAMPETAGGAAVLADPTGSRVDRPGHRRGGRAGKGPHARTRAQTGRPVHLGGDRRGHPRRVP